MIEKEIFDQHEKSNKIYFTLNEELSKFQAKLKLSNT